MMGKRTPIHKKIRLDFMDDNLVLVVSNSINESIEYLKAIYDEMKGVHIDTVDHAACMLQVDRIGCIMLFNYDSIEAYIICHEVGHVTNRLFGLAGIPLTDSTDEAYCYHNSMLFKMVAAFFKENNIKIRI